MKITIELNTIKDTEYYNRIDRDRLVSRVNSFILDPLDVGRDINFIANSVDITRNHDWQGAYSNIVIELTSCGYVKSKEEVAAENAVAKAKAALIAAEEALKTVKKEN